MDNGRSIVMTAAPTVVPVIMAGGSGTRLWPLSRELHPKQFLPLAGSRSLFQEAVRRAMLLDHAVAPLVIGADVHRFLIAEQLQSAGYKSAGIALEPEPRNTAPAAAVAAHFAAREFGPESLVLLLSADHSIQDQGRFAAAVRAAMPLAEAGGIVVFGIEPTYPETGYGYIRAGARLAARDGVACFEVAAFVEKPPAERAREFLEIGGYFWNGGMFMFRADRLLDALRELEPQILEQSGIALEKARRDNGFIRLDAEAFRNCRSDSIDYAVMEKSGGLSVVPLDAGWDDVGAWTFLRKLAPADEHRNHFRGDVVLHESEGNLVHASGRLVTLVGVKDHVVVETGDAVLITTPERAQNVKQLVQDLKKAQRREVESHPRVYRPWGFYETIAAGERFQVKRIQVKPGHKLSLQMHHHRAEHWVVVKGTARVTCGERVFLLSEDQSTYIPLGNTHRLENPGMVPLELIEVQSGAYLGEDDIVRFDDVYGRAATPAAETVAAQGATEPVAMTL